MTSLSKSASKPATKDDPRAELRRKARAARTALNQQQQHRAARSLLLRLGDHPMLTQSKHCAFYIPNDGEISPLLLMFRALQLGIHCYLPRLMAGNYLTFHHFVPGDTLTPNRFGIPEPRADTKAISARDLDVVFLPLVAFDNRGNRLGMGGGYYDRSFSFTRAIGPRPMLVGLAHQCQQTQLLDAQAWDVPLDLIATDKTLIKAKY